MISAEVLVESKNWKKIIRNPKRLVASILNRFPKNYKFINKKTYITILLTNNKKIKLLNKKFRNKNKPTDVLSFPFQNKIKNTKNIYLGDIAISYEIVKKKSKNSNFLLEFDKLWVHGYLHLLGHNHKKNKDFIKMKKLEELILNKFYKKN